MSYFLILNMQKLKASTIQCVQHHNQRAMESEVNHYIDKEKSTLNYDLLNKSKIDYLEVVEIELRKQCFLKRKSEKML
ncbi:plasmid recombination protein [Metabacillus endolithicus]|nr:plasmid recombination protein [Metabacillus endolithicus]UPG63607.1 plasmid recombination protein [Metabacillus endolithicus]